MFLHSLPELVIFMGRFLQTSTISVSKLRTDRYAQFLFSSMEILSNELRCHVFPDSFNVPVVLVDH